MPITEREEHGKDKVSFRCSDVGPKNCEWQISGNSEAEIMPKIEQHGREKHNMKIDEDLAHRHPRILRTLPVDHSIFCFRYPDLHHGLLRRNCVIGRLRPWG